MNLGFSKHAVTNIAGTLAIVVAMETSFEHGALHPEEPLRGPISPEQSRVTASEVSSTSYALTLSDITAAIDALKNVNKG